MSSIQIIGGGLAGLAAAYQFEKSGVDYELFEASPTFGGKVASSQVGGLLVDAGADNFLARPPVIQRFIQELGLGDSIELPQAKDPVQIYKEGELFPMPKGTYLGVPLMSSDEPVDVEPATTIGAAIRKEFSADVADYLVEPLLGGINASEIDNLELQSAAPKFAEAIENHGSLRAGLAKTVNISSQLPVFYGLKGTSMELVDAIVERLNPAKLHLDSPINELDPDRLTILATPAHASAGLFDPNSEIGQELSAIRYTHVGQVTLIFDESDVDPVLNSPGIVFPLKESKLISACSWLSAKWNRYQLPGKVVIRLTTGKNGADSHIVGPDQLSDTALTEALISELSEVVKVGEPESLRVVRWSNALPLYEVGHSARVGRIRQLAPINIAFAGAAYDGIGIPACLQSGILAAKSVTE